MCIRDSFVDDGSADATWEMIKKAHEAYPSVFTGISLDRNRGHQTALTEGLMACLLYTSWQARRPSP